MSLISAHAKNLLLRNAIAITSTVADRSFTFGRRNGSNDELFLPVERGALMVFPAA